MNAAFVSFLHVLEDEQRQHKVVLRAHGFVLYLRSRHVSKAEFTDELQRVLNPRRRRFDQWFSFEQGLSDGRSAPFWYVYSADGRLLAASRDRNRVMRILAKTKRSRLPYRKRERYLLRLFYGRK